MGMLGLRFYVECSADEDRCKQSFKDECDVNNILKRYTATGRMTHLARGVPSFLDVSETGDFRTAIEQVRAATEFFASLPSETRAVFKNDVVSFMDAPLTEEGRELLKSVKLEVKGAEPPVPAESAPPA